MGEKHDSGSAEPANGSSPPFVAPAFGRHDQPFPLQLKLLFPVDDRPEKRVVLTEQEIPRVDVVFGQELEGDRISRRRQRVRREVVRVFVHRSVNDSIVDYFAGFFADLHCVEPDDVDGGRPFERHRVFDRRVASARARAIRIRALAAHEIVLLDDPDAAFVLFEDGFAGIKP